MTSTDMGSKGHLGVNDLWFKFLEKRVSVSTYFDVFSNLLNITMIAKVCDRESRRDSWFENRLVCIRNNSKRKEKI